MNEVMHHIGNGVIVGEHTDEIGRAEMIAVDVPFFSLKDIERMKQGDIMATMLIQRRIFAAVPLLFSKHSGATQPPPEELHHLTIDGEKVNAWLVRGWRCADCKRTFIVSAKSQLVHGPCFEGAD
jgi:hypothetical protein